MLYPSSFCFPNLIFEAPILTQMCLRNSYQVECWRLFLLGVELFSPDSTEYCDWGFAALGEQIKEDGLVFTPFQSHSILKEDGASLWQNLKKN